MTSPTGEQHTISSGEHRATVTELGAGLRRYAVAGRDVLRGYAEATPVSAGAGQHLLPWPNRVRDGRYPWAGTEQQLVLSEPKRHNASHGLVRYVPWRLVDRGTDTVTLAVRVFPQPGWPGTLEAQVAYRVGQDGLTVTVSATNLGTDPFPFGYGAHPYLTVGEERVDEVTLTVPAATRLEVDDRMLPVARQPVAGGDLDLRDGPVLGRRLLDTAYTDLDRDADGRWTVRLSRGERWAEVWGDEAFRWAQVFTGDVHRDVGIAVEPMTCGPDALNPGPTHDDLLVLGPGDTFRASWGLRGR